MIARASEPNGSRVRRKPGGPWRSISPRRSRSTRRRCRSAPSTSSRGTATRRLSDAALPGGNDSARGADGVRTVDAQLLVADPVLAAPERLPRVLEAAEKPVIPLTRGREQDLDREVEDHGHRVALALDQHPERLGSG